MRLQIRPTITPDGVLFRVVSPGGFWGNDSTLCQGKRGTMESIVNVREKEMVYDSSTERRYFYESVLYKTPKEAADDVRRLYGETQTIETVYL